VKKSAQGKYDEGFTALLNLTFNMGLGEYGVGDDVLLVPSLMLMHMRTYTDPAKDHGKEQEVYDVDVQIAGLTLPIILPNDYTVVLGHTYVRPISFRADNVISYSNAPNLSLTKILPLPTGDVLSITAGTSYAFSTGDTLEQQIADEVYYNFIKAVMGGDAAVLAQQPINAQNAWTHTLNLSYIKPIGEQLTLTPSITVNRMEFTKGTNNGRGDTSYLAAVVAAYTISEWVNVSAATNYMWKRSSDSTLDFEDFIGGVTMGLNYAF
jgi:long-subunit fatty acid transport protein